MKDISQLILLTKPSSLKQAQIGMVVLALACAYAAYAFGAPWPMVAFIGAFWLLPLLGMKTAMRNVHAAVDAYRGNHSVGSQVKWIQYSDTDSYTYGAELDLGASGRWLIHLQGSECPYVHTKKDMPGVVTVWLHPENKEPRLIKSDQGYFYADKVERLLQ